MKKKGKLMICAILLAVSMIEVKPAEEDHTTTDENGNIVTDLPWDQGIEGKVYGSLIGKTKEDEKNDNINVEIPSKPDEQQRPSNPLPVPESNDHPNITKSNQETYGIKRDGKRKDGLELYKWEKHMEKLTIYPAMFTLAKTEKKNIVMRILDDTGKIRYRVKLRYEDFKNMENENTVFVFGANCVHKELIFDSAGTQDIAYLLQCKQEHIRIPAYIGVGVPSTWNREAGAYQYTFEKDEFVFIQKDLQIDEEHVVEVKMSPGIDSVFSDSPLPAGGKNLKTWIAGVQGKNANVNQGFAIASTVMYAGAGVLFIVLTIILLKRHVGNSIRRKVQPQRKGKLKRS